MQYLENHVFRHDYSLYFMDGKGESEDGGYAQNFENRKLHILDISDYKAFFLQKQSRAGLKYILCKLRF